MSAGDRGITGIYETEFRRNDEAFPPADGRIFGAVAQRDERLRAEHDALELLIGAAHEGAIYLLHSVSQTNAEVLGEVIDGIRDEGFEFEKLK